jgi:hypothetical protein
VPALDALRACWILVVFIMVFFWFPARLFSGRTKSVTVMQIAGNGARTVLSVTIAVLLLASLRLLNVLTVISLFVGVLAIDWLRKRARMSGGLLMSLEVATIEIMRKIEVRAFGLHLLARKRPLVPARSSRWLRINRWLQCVEGRELLVACLAVVVITTVVLRGEHAVRELRFDQSEQYSLLLRARELMLNLHPIKRPFVFPAVIATISFLSGADPMQVTRVLSPVIELSVVLATGLLIHVCARAGVASVAVVYCLGAAALPLGSNDTVIAISATQKFKALLSSSPAMMRAGTDFGLGVLFLVLALAFLADWYRNERGWDSLLDFACCLVLTGIVSQLLLLILVTVGGVVLLRPMVGLVAFVLACYSLVAYLTLSTSVTVADEMRAILPVTAAILVGCFLAVIENKLFARAGTTGQTLVLGACVCVAMTWFRPQGLGGQYVEYESAARATEEIASGFPRQTWVVVAPVEQLAETLGLGAYEDLAGFVEKYQGRVLSSDFRFPEGQEDLFIYVEKRPFQIFAREPEIVSFSVLTDPTYRNYRSPGGRASLEAAALRLCERYRQGHPDTDVFFENEDLRIYHVHQQWTSDSKRRQ